MPRDILYISADRNYSNIITADGDERTVVHQLGQIEGMIANQLKEEALSFIRIGRGLIINRKYIYFINTQRQQLILKSPKGTLHQLKAAQEPLVQLKKIIEQEIIKND